MNYDIRIKIRFQKGNRQLKFKYFEYPTKDMDICYLASYIPNTNANHKCFNDA